MPNALKNVVESGATTLSDLVDDARSMIEDLPPLAHARHKKARKNWSSLVVLVLVAFVAVFAAKQLRHSSPTVAESTTL